MGNRGNTFNDDQQFPDLTRMDTEELETFAILAIPNGKSLTGYRTMRAEQRAQNAYLEAKRREADASRAMLVSAPQVRFLDPKTLRTAPETQVKSKNAKLEGWLLLSEHCWDARRVSRGDGGPQRVKSLVMTSSTFGWSGASPLQTAPVTCRKTSIMATASKSRKQMRVQLRKAEKARPVFSLDVPRRGPRDVTQQITELLDEFQ